MKGSLGNYKRIALIFQGGGALGAYQIGVFNAICDQDIQPNCAVGISIGAFTAAIIAGNKPENRLDKLRSFWNSISWPEVPKSPSVLDQMRTIHSKIASLQGVIFGQPNFFVPRFPGPSLQPRGTAAATSYYDTSRLKTTLLSHIDFDLLNSKKTQLILGATRVKDSQLIFFDNHNTKILPEHIMASGAMPPGFPGVRIEGDLYWDGGCVSNTPLESMYNLSHRQDTLNFIVELFNTDGSEPSDMDEVLTRSKDILYTSRTEHHIQHLKEKHKLKELLHQALLQVDMGKKKNTDLASLSDAASDSLFDVVHLIYNVKKNEERIQMYEFSKSSIKAREEVGYQDTLKALENLDFSKSAMASSPRFRHKKFLSGEPYR
jgi:NTE family protein